MVRIPRDERLVDLRGVVVAKLLEVELAEVAVNLVGIASVTVLGEILVEDFRAAEVRKTQADDPERIRHAVFFVSLVERIEVEAGRQAMVEHRNEAVERLFVHLLLV